VRLRTTVVATLVVTLALLLGAVGLVVLVRDSLHDGIESTAEERASSLAKQIERSGLQGLPPSEVGDVEEPNEVVWQVFNHRREVVA